MSDLPLFLQFPSRHGQTWIDVRAIVAIEDMRLGRDGDEPYAVVHTDVPDSVLVALTADTVMGRIAEALGVADEADF